MPIKGPQDCGTDASGGKTEDFCCNCFRRGRFTEPYITLEEMILRVAKTMNATMGLGQHEAAKMAAELIPRLKRWKKA
jgi:hypothetical protein